jgi:hypothetical protein
VLASSASLDEEPWCLLVGVENLLVVHFIEVIDAAEECGRKESTYTQE